MNSYQTSNKCVRQSFKCYFEPLKWTRILKNGQASVLTLKWVKLIKRNHYCVALDLAYVVNMHNMFWLGSVPGYLEKTTSLHVSFFLGPLVGKTLSLQWRWNNFLSLNTGETNYESYWFITKNWLILQERASYLEYQKVMREVEHLSRLYIAYQFVMAEVIALVLLQLQY